MGFLKLDYGDMDTKRVAAGLAAIGVWRLGAFALTALRGITKYCLWPRKNLYKRYGGGWAIVTGASDGIGKGYALQLAKAGFNVCLMARNKERLAEVAAEVRSKYTVSTKVIVQDFGKLTNEEEINELKAKIEDFVKDHDTSILVNNVGYASTGLF
jgi:17beta-estradiol 17-dehydrogenase / very-long-chain 3-oxoacyl-CoA reductase